MKRGNKQLLVVGDRVLVKPEKAESMTKVGLYLPATVVEKEDVRGGTVVALGPGTPLPPPAEEQEPWKSDYKGARYLPMQVQLTYINPSGEKFIQVINDYREVTQDRNQLLSETNFSLFSSSTLQKVSKLIKEDSLAEAEA